MSLKSKIDLIDYFFFQKMNDLDKPINNIEFFSEKHGVITYTSIPKVESFKSKLMFKEPYRSRVEQLVRL